MEEIQFPESSKQVVELKQRLDGILLRIQIESDGIMKKIMKIEEKNKRDIEFIDVKLEQVHKIQDRIILQMLSLRCTQNQFYLLKHKFENDQTLTIKLAHFSQIPHLLADLTTVEKLQIIGPQNCSHRGLLNLPKSLFTIKCLKCLKIQNWLAGTLAQLISELKNLEHFEELQIVNVHLVEVECIKQLVDLKKISMVNVGLEQFPQFFFKMHHIKSLNIMFNKITHIPHEIAQMSQLQQLNVGINNFSSLALEDMFRNLKQLRKLKKLQLYGLNLKQSNMKQLFFLTQLEYLDLQENDFLRLPSQIANLRKLKKLLFNTQIQLPAEFANLTQLTEFNPSHKITHLSSSFCKLHKLTYLNLEMCQLLTELPIEIGNLLSLTLLKLPKGLTHLPQSIGSLQNLQQLQLIMKGSQLNCLPKQIGKLKKLTRMVINNSKLTQLPDQICNIISLQVLDLQYNKICELPAQIGRLQNAALFLSYNNLSRLPSSFSRLKLYIDVSHNPLEAGTRQFLGELKKSRSSLNF